MLENLLEVSTEQLQLLFQRLFITTQFRLAHKNVMHLPTTITVSFRLSLRKVLASPQMLTLLR